jgi:hypothetical protein
LSLLLLKICPDDIGVGNFAAGLALPRNGAESDCLRESTIRDSDFGVSGKDVVIILDHGYDESATRDFQASPGSGGVCICASEIGESGTAKRFGHDTLAHVLVDSIVGDKANRGGWLSVRGCVKSGSLRQGALGVQKLIVIHDSGKKRGASDSALGLRDAGIGDSGAIGRLD